MFSVTMGTQCKNKHLTLDMAQTNCQETRTGIKQQTKTDKMKESNWIQIGFLSVADPAPGHRSQ